MKEFRRNPKRNRKNKIERWRENNADLEINNQYKKKK